jgi:hypothetical protein
MMAMAQKNYPRMNGWIALCAGFAGLAICVSSFGQVLQPPGTFPPSRRFSRQQGPPPSSNIPPTASAADATQPPAENMNGADPTAPTQVSPSAPRPALPSLLDKPAKPAQIHLDDGRLAIEADNSSLSEILHQVSQSSGMTVEGLGQDQRIFGSYGPGDPHEVLSALLTGSGYNVVMLGQTAKGSPRQLTLTQRGAGVPTGPSNRPTQASQDDDVEDEPQPQQSPDPGPSLQSPQNNPNSGQPNGVRTPQQMLQELQQMRQQQQQLQQQQPPQ